MTCAATRIRLISNSHAHARPITVLTRAIRTSARAPASFAFANEIAPAAGIPEQIHTSKCQAFGIAASTPARPAYFGTRDRTAVNTASASRPAPN